MVGEEEGSSAPESSVDLHCPVFARLNLAFPKASWDDPQR